MRGSPYTRCLKHNKNFPNRIKIPDEEIIKKYKEGWFLSQIRAHYIIGIVRLRKLIREDIVEGLDG
jgi:hypothetical protein